MKRFIGNTTLAVALVVGIAACSKDTKTETPSAGAPTAEKKEENEGGRVIIVEATSDSVGNYFKPSEIEAHKGDILRFTLKAGVHNVHFLADSNAGKSGLPAASDMLQIPGQTYDFKVTLAGGKYYFQCDPHALLGMKGHLKVED